MSKDTDLARSFIHRLAQIRQISLEKWRFNRSANCAGVSPGSSLFVLNRFLS